MEFVSQFGYSYDALSREPPASIKEDEEIRTWRELDKRKVFLGKFANHNLQILYEEISEKDKREQMPFTDMVTLFTDRFKQSTNLSLANFCFRQLTEDETESFDAYTIRVKREAKNCDFKCQSLTCTVIDTMVRDQILFGTRESEIRKTARNNGTCRLC